MLYGCSKTLKERDQEEVRSGDMIYIDRPRIRRYFWRMMKGRTAVLSTEALPYRLGLVCGHPLLPHVAFLSILGYGLVRLERRSLPGELGKPAGCLVNQLISRFLADKTLKGDLMKLRAKRL